MKCSHCGAEYEGNFCPECGARAESQSPATPPPIQQPTANRQNPVPPVGGNVAAYQKPKKPKKPIYKKWWFYVIAAVALIAIISAISGGKGKDEKIEWSKIELRDQLPEPPSNMGTLYENSDEEFWVSLDGVTDDQYNDYLDTCVGKGFTVDSKKDSNSYKAFNKAGYSLELSHYSDDLSIQLKAPMEFAAISWPTGAAGKRLPSPKSLSGKFDYENDDSFSVYIGNTSKSDYEEYVKSCADKGFTVDYDKGNDYYNADDNDGWSISLKYEGNNIMNIQIDAPDEKNSKDSKSSPTTSSSKSSDSTESKPTESGSSKNLINGMRKDFKDAMDSYETFMDEYVAFMKKYSDNPNDVGLLADYTKYMSKYADMVEKFDKWESEDLNDAELAYYIDVQTRVNKKLLEVAN